mgnify:CR=1 FL=1
MRIVFLSASVGPPGNLLLLTEAGTVCNRIVLPDVGVSPGAADPGCVLILSN